MRREVEQIKDRLDIVDLVGSYIKLDKAGSNYKAKCPFHNEKTPSFMVSPERQSFYCFGCQAKGDIFSFIEKFEGLDFVGALKLLSEKAGVKLEYSKRDGYEDKNNIFLALEKATIIYEDLLSNSPEQKKYLIKRGLKEGTIKKWRIGWANKEWRNLLERMKNEGFKESDLLLAGLIKKANNSEKVYDVFRGRIMFPIFDSSGRVIAFSGRIFNDDGKSPKYVNTPETEFFKKSEILYGLHEAKLYIRKLDYSVIVEGQFDLVLSHQSGVKNTIATSGTALSETHLKKLQKLSKRCIIAYDSDLAGKSAARRSAELALSLGMEVKIARLPENEDPASLIARLGDEWKISLKSSLNVIEFAINESISDSTIDGRLDSVSLAKEFSRNVLPLLCHIESEILKNEMVSLSSKKTKIPEDSIWKDMKRFEGKISEDKNYAENIGNDSFKKPSFSILSQEEMLVGVVFLLKDKNFRERADKLFGKEVFEYILNNGRFDRDTLLFETENRFLGLDLKKVAEELLVRFEKNIMERKLYEIGRDLDVSKDQEKISKLKIEADRISKRISELSSFNF